MPILLEDDAMTVLCVIPGPSELVKTEPDDRDTRWCFTCRRHRPHTWHLFKDPEPLAPYLSWPELDGYAVREVIGSLSYYDPIWSLRCPSGHRDTEFPRGIW